MRLGELTRVVASLLSDRSSVPLKPRSQRCHYQELSQDMAQGSCFLQDPRAQ